MTSALFSPITLGEFTIPNRIAVAPMCMYSAEDGSATDWHIQHWMTLGISGAGMITFEATGVERRGRISPNCLGLYSDANEAAMARALGAARQVAAPGAVFGVQLGHAGRKASTQLPWLGGPLTPEQGAWQTVGPSAIPFAPGWPTPTALDETGIEQIVTAFVDAALRAERAGLDFVELHGAHGYLLHEFLSPISNQRTDRWGGSLENRMRLIVTVAKAVRAALPERMFVGARLSATEWVERDHFNADEAVEVAKALKAAGVVYICASTGGNAHDAQIPIGPLYQVEFAEKIRAGADIVTRAVGLITTPAEAEALLLEGRADMVALARAILADPRWPWRAAYELGAEAYAPPQYLRSLTTMKHWVAEEDED